MKQFYQKIAWIVLPVGLLLVLLPVDKRLAYIGLKDTCFNHGIWMHDRIYQNEKGVDIAFLGSSFTVNGIDDKLIENELKSLSVSVANFGFCTLGRNLSYVLLKEILQKKQPKYLIVEVRDREDRYSHNIFPHIAGTRDVLFTYPFFNRDILKDIITHFKYKVDLTQDFLFRRDNAVPIQRGNFGFAASEDTVAAEVLADFEMRVNKARPPMDTWVKNFYAEFARGYLDKLYEVCELNDIQLIFLYCPPYGLKMNLPEEYSTYLKYGKVIMPPQQLLYDKDYWHDKEHLNKAGASVFSTWVAKELQRKMASK